MGAVLDKNSLTWTVPSLLGRGEWLAIMKRWQNGIHCQESVFQFLLLKPAAPDPNHTMSACFPCYRVQEPDFNTACDWPVEIIETIEPMQKQPSKLQKKFVWEKYPPWEIWPIYTININDSCLKSSSEARRWVCVTVMMVGSRVPALYCHSSLHCLVLSHRWCWGTNLPCICYHDLEHCC